MKIIKKLDIFILRNYLMLFAGTFCISLFVVMMQFLWKYVDELVGKGLSLTILAKFFFYAGESLVPLALPLGVLLASLISFGNLGERFELLAIKASGVSLFRTLRPLIVFNTIIAGISFYFQNNIAPQAQENLLTLRWSILQASPEVDIPEGVFYNGVPGMNMYVKKKNKENGQLYNVIIYNMRDGVNNAHIILADSGKLETSADKKAMVLHLWNGEQFENIANNGLGATNVPYRRETFVSKHFIIDYDTNFNMEDNEAIGQSASTKRMSEIVSSVDSLTVYYDSMAISFYNDMAVRCLFVGNSSRARAYPEGETEVNYGTLIDPATGAPTATENTGNAENSENTEAKADSQTTISKDSSKHTVQESNDNKTERRPHMAKIPELAHLQKNLTFNHKQKVNLDTLYAHLDNTQKQNVVMGALQRVNIAEMDIDYKASVMDFGEEQIRRHWVEYWTKITMAIACLLFFFIGAPLGAIIRKGGLGMPVIIAVLFFIFYYIINTGGMRAGREGSIPLWIGMWLSTMILAPIAVFLTVKSNNDSVMFNMDPYRNFFRRLTGKRIKRHIPRKEVIINDPDYKETLCLVDELLEKAKDYRNECRHTSIIKYAKYLYQHNISRKWDEEADALSLLLEHIVDILSNTKDKKVLVYINSLPVLETHSFRFYRRRRNDMKGIIEFGGMLQERIKEIIYEQSTIQ